MTKGVSALPPKGMNRNAVLKLMKSYRPADPDFKRGKTWSLVYYLSEEHTKFLQKAYDQFFSENGLNPMAFQSLKRFESEVIRMAAGIPEFVPPAWICPDRTPRRPPPSSHPSAGSGA